ncbi:hypothetical protein D3C86_2242910 [compost metagenome]
MTFDPIALGEVQLLNVGRFHPDAGGFFEQHRDLSEELTYRMRIIDVLLSFIEKSGDFLW